MDLIHPRHRMEDLIMTNKYNQKLFTVRYAICILIPLTGWDIIVEDPTKDKLGTKVNKRSVYCANLDKGKVEPAVKKVMDYQVVSVDFIENVIFCTKEDINK